MTDSLALLDWSALDEKQRTATLTEEITGPQAKTVFARVSVTRGDAGWEATPTGKRGSNLISTVSRANGLAVIPVGTDVTPAGARVRVMIFRSTED